MIGGLEVFTALSIPAEYSTLPAAHLDFSAQDIAYLYDDYARDKACGTTAATTFVDAVRHHRLTDQVAMSSHQFLNHSRAAGRCAGAQLRSCAADWTHG
jgi:hypothetical protein